MVTLPYRPESAAIRPSASAHFANGTLPPSVLAPCGIRSLVLVEPAATSMRAMVRHAAGDGVTISATGTYRSYEQQRALFLARYSPTPIPGRPSKWWQGKQWWLKPGMAGAATPGTSNHGTGLAADLSDTPTVPLSERTLRWLATWGPQYGWFNTVRSEPWHWCYVLGDDLPPRLQAPEPVPPIDPPDPEPPTEETDVDLFVTCARLRDTAPLYVVWATGAKTWLRDPGARDAFFALRKLAGKDTPVIVVADDATFRALGPIVGPQPDGVDGWGVPT